jgi:hypothetical protein
MLRPLLKGLIYLFIITVALILFTFFILNMHHKAVVDLIVVQSKVSVAFLGLAVFLCALILGYIASSLNRWLSRMV